MARKVDGTERSGRGTAPPAAGAFGGSDTALTRLARPFTPKPFRSTGGMSTSADTMMSIGMGRHNTDEEIPDDQVNISGIVSRKVSDRRYLPRKLKNMQMYLHTTPLSEALDLDSKEIKLRCESFEKSLGLISSDSINEEILDTIKSAVSKGAEFIGKNFSSDDPNSVGGISPEMYTGLSVVAPFVPVIGDVFYGYSAYNSIKDIMQQAEKLQDFLASIGIDVNLTDAPERNVEKLSRLKISRASDRAYLKEAILKIGIKCFEALSLVIAALPLDLIPVLKPLDFITDLGITGTSFIAPGIDPEGEKITDALIRFSQEYGDVVRSIGKYVPGLEESVNFMGNLGEMRKAISTGETEVSHSSEDPDVLAERRRRKKRRTNEFSGVGSIAGYTGPMKSPADPKHFYDTMAHAAGSEYLVDPVKNSKARP